MALITIDFEASCLPRHGRSYPIEVGIADASGRSRGWLISPHPRWDGWDWTEEAERLHGISRKQLLREGQPAGLVAAELGKALMGHRVVADSPLDTYWLDELAKAGNAASFPKLELIGGALDELKATTDDIMIAQTILERRPFRRHRARDDASWLFALIEILAEHQHAGGHVLGASVLSSCAGDRVEAQMPTYIRQSAA